MIFRLRFEFALLASLLGGAGLWHLVRSQDFLPAIPLLLSSWAMAIVLVTGVFELVLALPILFFVLFPHHPSGRVLSSKTLVLSAVYFLVLLWAHLEVSVRGTPIFGIDDSWLLWLRTFLQLPLILWTYFLSRRVLSLSE